MRIEEEFANHIRDKVVFPVDDLERDFNPGSIIVADTVPNDPLELLIVRTVGSVPAGDQQDRHDVSVQMLARAQTSGRASDLVQAIYDADALCTKDPRGRKYHFRNDMQLPNVRIARLFWTSAPFSMGAQLGGFMYSATVQLTYGNN